MQYEPVIKRKISWGAIIIDFTIIIIATLLSIIFHDARYLWLLLLLLITGGYTYQIN